jgi:hypothetical protein
MQEQVVSDLGERHRRSHAMSTAAEAERAAIEALPAGLLRDAFEGSGPSLSNHL